MNTSQRWIVPLVLACCGSATAADDAGLRACRALAETAARLACYDALPLAALPSAVPGPAAVPAQVPVPAPAPAAAAQAFGRARTDDLIEVVSHIPGNFEGWGPRTRFTLANGQVWQVVDDSSGVYALRDPKVTVRRAAISGYELDIEGARRVPRVRRID